MKHLKFEVPKLKKHTPNEDLRGISEIEQDLNRIMVMDVTTMKFDETTMIMIDHSGTWTSQELAKKLTSELKDADLLDDGEFLRLDTDYDI